MSTPPVLSENDREHFWPPLPFAEWQTTAETLHMWTQIIGKIRLALSPWINHSWHVALYLTSRGLTTSPIPHGLHTFEIRFDFISHELRLLKSDGALRVLPLQPQSVATFYGAVMAALSDLQLPVKIDPLPNEITDPIPFDRDETHRAYDPAAANRFWRVLLQSDRVLTQFRSRFCGKCSPAHFFWGSFDLAVTRFSGRPAPVHPGGIPHLPDVVTREAYAQEVSSVGFWPGEGYEDAAFYSYTAPEPPGFRDAGGMPDGAFYDTKVGEYIVMYDHVRSAPSPSAALLAFCRATYEAGADRAGWDRAALER